ncbi:alpha/beta fold hydrolase [Candidatus Paracaedibacter symbiosus]|uniref:alpha/beta fold hydrolase n=1 Tax=Candidatus Paracaedibacter symbiosus TaxID=244582 RepID=UPI0018DCE084|nr:alpha/beta hydrolase [Candidatus Paracaedibacter symbiosus]
MSAFIVAMGEAPAAAKVQYGFFTTYDHLLIRSAKVPSKVKPTKGTILLLQGMGGFVEYYLDIMHHLSDRGYDVLTLDWRGQGDSGRFTDQRTLLYIDNFDSYVKDLKVFMSLNPHMTRPVIFMASSMGGNIALHYAHDHPEDMDAIIALAPMIKINTSPYPYSFAEGLVKFIVSIGLGERFVFGYEPFSYEMCVKNYNPVKNGDKKIYLQDCRLLKEEPHLAVGGPSFQWLDEAFKASADFNNDDYLKEIKVPFLMVSSENDYLVNVDAQTKLCKVLPNCELLTYQDSHHNILKDSRNVISRLIKDVDTFFVNFEKGKNFGEPQQQYVYRQNAP